jgi:selenocysteine-specific elongation factor
MPAAAPDGKGAAGDRGREPGAAGPDPERQLSPLERQLLSSLRQAGRDGLEPRRLKFRGAADGLRRLARLGLAVELEGEIHLARETYLHLCDALLAGLRPGDRLTLAQARTRTALSRKYLLPLLNRLQSDGLLRRLNGDREVTAEAGG